MTLDNRKRKGGDRVNEIIAENGRLKLEVEALGAWKCVSCGCRFGQLPTPEFLLEGVTHCTKCAEVQALSSLNQDLAAGNRAMLEINERQVAEIAELMGLLEVLKNAKA